MRGWELKAALGPRGFWALQASPGRRSCQFPLSSNGASPAGRGSPPSSSRRAFRRQQRKGLKETGLAQAAPAWSTGSISYSRGPSGQPGQSTSACISFHNCRETVSNLPVADSGKDAIQRGFYSSARGCGPRSCHHSCLFLASVTMDGYSVCRARVTECVLSRKTLSLFL